MKVKNKELMQKKLLISFIAIIALTGNAKADLLVTNSGQELKGDVRNITNKSVTITIDGVDNQIGKDDILRLELSNGSNADKVSNLSELSDEALNSALANKVSPADYPNAGYISLLSETRLTYTKEGAFEESYRNIVQILKERGRDAGIVSLSYKTGVQTARVDHGRTINDDKVYVFDQTSLRESSVYYRYPDYNLIKSIRFPLSNIVVGSVLDHSFTITQSTMNAFEPVFISEFFAGSEPVKKQRLVIKCPKDNADKLKISTKLMGEEGKDYTFSESQDGDYIVKVYEKSDIEAIENESYMPSFDIIMPKVTVSISPDFDDITRNYKRKLDSNLVINSDITEKVAELTKGIDDRESKILKIYEYITTEINLINVPMESSRYIPQKSNYILEKKSANSLDKTFLFYTFLKAAQINCEFVLGRVRDQGEPLSENPSISQFTYPLVIVPLDMTTLYLTVNDKNLKITDIESPIQGGYGLVVSQENGKIIKIPLKSADKENTSIKYQIVLFEDGSITIKENKEASGNSQGSFRMMQYMPEKNLRQYMIERIHEIHPNAELISYKFENLKDLTKNPSMEIIYSIKDYMISAGGKLFAFQLPSLSYSAYGVGKDERKYPLSFGTLVSNNSEYILKLPTNYKMYYLPGEYSYKSGNFIYDASYKADGKKIVFQDSYQRLASDMPKNAYFDLKKCLETKAELAKEWIVIEKIDDEVSPN